MQFFDQDNIDITAKVHEIINEIKSLVEKKKIDFVINGRTPAIFVARTLEGNKIVGWHYASTEDKIGTHFHYDHGIGTHRNTDAMYVWISPETEEELKQPIENIA